MTNEEIIRRQREHREHQARLPLALDEANLALQRVADGELVQLTPSALSTLLREIALLQAARKQASQDMRDEQREGQHAAAAAFSEGRHEGLNEGRGW